MRRPALGAVLALAVALAACSDDGDRDEAKEDAADEPASTAVEVEQIRIPVGDLTFDAIAAGPDNGEPVLLLHGFPQTSASFRPQLEALAQAGYRAIAPDQRGYSADARPEGIEAYSILNLVEDVTGMADELGIETFHLLGHDWGGAVAWTYATVHPDRLLSLNVLATPHPRAFAAAYNTPGSDQADRSWYMDFLRAEGAEDRLLADDAAMLRAFMGAGELDDEQLAPYLDVLGTPEALGAAINWYRAMDTGPVDLLPAITTPTLFAFAGDDIAFTPEVAEASAQYVDAPYRYEVLDGVSHWMTEDAPDEVTALLLENLRAYPARS